uniref:Uncharacterized protein n=1 Tax=Oryza punctata TaxID=4537 RepID=A0A0E0L6F4_ORYPU
MAAIKLDLPVPGGPYSSVSNVDGWWRSIGDHESEYSFMYIWRILSWSFMALAVAMMNGRYDFRAFSLCFLWKLSS